MRQPQWDKYEVALLIEAYWRIKKNQAVRSTVVSELSASLRKRASFEIDNTYRNENGISMRLGELDYLFSDGKAGLKNTSDLFRDMVRLYVNNRKEFEIILLEAKGMSSKSLNLRFEFCEWLQRIAPNQKPETICLQLLVGEEFCQRIKVLTKPLFETTDLDTVKKYVKTVTNNKIFRIRNKKQHPALVNAANLYYSFIRILPELGVLEFKAEDGVQTSNGRLPKEDSQSDESTPNERQLGIFDTEFYNWLLFNERLAIRTCQSYVSALRSAETFAKEHGLDATTICTNDCEVSMATVSALMQNEEFLQVNQVQHHRFSAAFQKLNRYFVHLFPEKARILQPIKSPDEPHRGKKEPEIVLPTLTKEVDELLRNAGDGITKADICEHLSGHNAHQVNLAIAACHAVLVMKKYYHPDNISDYQEMADVLLEVLTRQFSQNGNYSSAQQLYNEARAKLDDFFFYNNAFDSRQEVYDLAVHLFVQEKYKGNSFIFMNNTHIWKEEPDYPKDYHGLLIKYAREHRNVFSREEAVSYFDQIGSPSSAQTFSNVLYNTGSRSFLQYSENQFILTEALHVNDYFLATVKTQIENLLEGEDYIATGEIDDYFYTTLPSLSSGICWSTLLLEDLLRVYDIGFAAIEAGSDNDKKTIPAAIVRKDSPFRTFGDVVWNEVSKSFTLPKGFTAQEFREFLLDQGFIRGNEKKDIVHKTVSGDIRFFWTDNYGRVTIN